MSSLVERLRVRSDRRPVYNIDESDDEADFVTRKNGTAEEKFEKIVRSDAVCFLLILLFILLYFLTFSMMEVIFSFDIWKKILLSIMFYIFYSKFQVIIVILSFCGWLLSLFQNCCVFMFPFYVENLWQGPLLIFFSFGGQ